MPETGAAHGRAGGRIGSGVRLRKKLTSAPRMAVLAVVPSSLAAGNLREGPDHVGLGPCLAEHLNARVGYYVNPTDGFLKHDILAKHRTGRLG